MFVECCEISFWESFPKGRPNVELGWESKKLTHIRVDAHEAWCNTTIAYSKADLTKYEDKTVALA